METKQLLTKTTFCEYNSPKRREDGKYIEHDTIPHLCQIELTYVCNQNCICCYNPERTKKIGDLSVTDRIVRSIAESQIPHVCLLGGEPSLLPIEKLNEYIELLSEHSSASIITNGFHRLDGISDKLAYYAIPVHGPDAKTHEIITQAPGGFYRTIETIKQYVNEGRDVRCVPLLTGYNYDRIYEIIRLATHLGMESVYVDRFEDGGIGAINSPHKKLKPTMEQFRIGLAQIIRAKHDFSKLEGRVGFGTAIPYCLDERLVNEGIACNCGVGKDFCVINPQGEFRMCNQSQLFFGNVLDEPVEVIWNKRSLDIFRDLSWVNEPCKSCQLLLACTGGCKVDVNCSNVFCVDYAVRGLSKPINEITKKEPKQIRLTQTKPKSQSYRIFRPSRYAKLTIRYPEKFLVTRYQTIKLDGMALEMAQMVLHKNITDERDLVTYFSDRVKKSETRFFVSQMIKANAIDLVEEVANEDRKRI